jgi:uncharacterized protein YjbI with pentapeptide repeats
VLWGVGIFVAVVLVAGVVYVGYSYPRTSGFGPTEVSEGVRPAKTVWDWLKLLGVPVVLAVAGYLFTRSERQSTQYAAEQRTQDEALQTYLEQIGLMLLDEDNPLRGFAESEDPSDSALQSARLRKQEEARNLARSRTLTVLSRIDGERKATVVRFLYESALIGRQEIMKSSTEKIERIIDLRGADLSGAQLHRAALNEANLSGTDLSGADLTRALLDGADLSGADLSGADLSRAILPGANLGEAKPTAYNPTPFSSADQQVHTNLSGANLSAAVMYGANIKGADLRGANLKDARVLHPRAAPFGLLTEFRGWSGIGEGSNLWLHLQANDLRRVTMPDGRKYEDWLSERRTKELLKEYQNFLHRDE